MPNLCQQGTLRDGGGEEAVSGSVGDAEGAKRRVECEFCYFTAFLGPSRFEPQAAIARERVSEQPAPLPLPTTGILKLFIKWGPYI